MMAMSANHDGATAEDSLDGRGGVAASRGRADSRGRVAVNGEVVRTLGTKADPTTDQISVDGRRVKMTTRPRYILLNKPRGYVTTRHDPEGRRR